MSFFRAVFFGALPSSVRRRVCPRLFFFFFFTPAAGRAAEGFLGGFPSFSVPARRRLGGRAAGAFFVVRLFFLVFFASLVEASALQAPPRGSTTPPRLVFPFVLPFFPLAWQDRARSSSFGRRPFFFLSGREAHRRGDPRFHSGSAGLGPGGGEGATFFFGVGRDPQTRFAGGVDDSGRKAFRPAAGRLFRFPPAPPVAPRQADAVALRRELQHLKAHPSTVEIDRLRFRARAPRRRRSEAVEDPLAVVFPLFFRSIPRRSVSPAAAHDLDPVEEKALGPAAFFFRRIARIRPTALRPTAQRPLVLTCPTALSPDLPSGPLYRFRPTALSTDSPNGP